MFLKWFTIGIGVKRWLLLLTVGIYLIAIGFSACIIQFQAQAAEVQSFLKQMQWQYIIFSILIGVGLIIFSLIKLSRVLLAPYRRHQHGKVVDIIYAHSQRKKGLKIVAIGGGTGLPAVLRGMKAYTSNITAVVTVADDGGSSGKLRRELGVLPPGDLRNNIAALADDESLMTQLFQYRFNHGDLHGHAFGNLFIAALAGISGGIENALPEVERVLNMQGRVLPATLDDINLVATVRQAGKNHAIRIQGESKISEIGGFIEQLSINPKDAVAYSESVAAILDADLVIIGPGSLFTSIIPNLLVQGIAQALQESKAFKVYVCNVATQPGETENFTVAEHVVALEKYIGRGVFQAVIANNNMPVLNAGVNTVYVMPSTVKNEILQRYIVRYTDLTDEARPWRHDTRKLTRAILKLLEEEKAGASRPYIEPSIVNQ